MTYVGAPGAIRTRNLRIRSPRLYPLSYGRKLCHKKHLRFSDHKPIFWHDNRDDYLWRSPCWQWPGGSR
jgi:hypothetical protein